MTIKSPTLYKKILLQVLNQSYIRTLTTIHQTHLNPS
nr:MAG TPA_asm: hypothetical protein [Caudoviricetes sp.]